jgi:MFS family permease
VSYLVSGILMDRFGRRKIIAIKATLTLVCMIPLIPLGFMNGQSKISTVLTFYFFSIFFSTFCLDLMLFGFEKLPKENRDNYIIILASTRILGIAFVCIIFYWANKWVYFIIM